MRPIVASDLMTSDVLTVKADMTVAELAGFLSEQEITGAPVEDGAGRVVGVVSVVDLARADSEEAGRRTAWESFEADSYVHDWDQTPADGEIRVRHLHDGQVTVADIMNPTVHSVESDATVAEIARKMLDLRLHRLLVVEDDRLAGIISTSDLIGLLIEDEF
jgi:CBS domain-containing protein